MLTINKLICFCKALAELGPMDLHPAWPQGWPWDLCACGKSLRIQRNYPPQRLSHKGRISTPSVGQGVMDDAKNWDERNLSLGNHLGPTLLNLRSSGPALFQVTAFSIGGPPDPAPPHTPPAPRLLPPSWPLGESRGGKKNSALSSRKKEKWSLSVMSDSLWSHGL